MYNWQKCNDGDYRYVNFDLIEHDLNKEKYDHLYDQYLKRFGLTEEFERYMGLLQKKALKQCDYVINKKRFTLTEIEIIDGKLERLNVNFGDGQSVQQTCIHLGKWLGYKVDLKETTVVEFYEIIKEYTKYGKWTNKTQ